VPDRGQETYRKLAHFAGSDLPGHVGGLLDVNEDLSGLIQQELAGSRKPDTAPASFEELNPQVRLEPLYLAAERRLRHVQMLRRASEAELFGDCDEVAQAPKLNTIRMDIHGGNLAKTYQSGNKKVLDGTV
jgi:hypothetical protein